MVMDYNNILNQARRLAGKNNLVVFDLKTIEYKQAWQLQSDLAQLAKNICCQGFLLLLEHYPVITIGSNRSRDNLISSPETLKLKKIGLVQSNRGGDITFHGPGQLVGYPIINLNLFSKDISLYVWRLEQILIDTLKYYCLPAYRIPGQRGVYVDRQKIASLGIKVKRWVTMHGFALNVNTDLDYFNHIVACGLSQNPPVSMQKLLDQTILLAPVKEQITAQFEHQFKTEAVWA